MLATGTTGEPVHKARRVATNFSNGRCRRGPRRIIIVVFFPLDLQTSISTPLDSAVLGRDQKRFRERTWPVR
jgi:hypothetical protein